jgi:hypothetical protein
LVPISCCWVVISHNIPWNPHNMVTNVAPTSP